MSDRKEQNQQHDDFSQYIRQQLKGHQVFPDAACWDEIGMRMKKRRNLLFLRRGLYIAGAAVLALMLWVVVPADEDMPVVHSDVIEETASSDVKTTKSIEMPVFASTDVKPLEKARAVAVVQTTVTETTPVQVEVIDKDTDFEEAANSVSGTQQEVEPEPETDDDVANGRKKLTELPVLPDGQVPIPRNSRQKNNWQVGAGVLAMGKNSLTIGGGGGTNGHLISNADNGWIPMLPEYNNYLHPEDCDDISYDLPLSFGITVRKELGRKLSVETGLMYTYLSTNLRKDNPNPIKGKLGLHYLGIPVNLIVDLWNKPKWNVYASGGVMVEKGLRSVYTETFYRTNSESKTIVRTSIRGLQWSLNGSVGISYRVLNDWSVYAEPRVSYFMDNHQPISVRTDKSLTLGFGMGVRFDF